jgi:hypothetical protein
MTPQDLLELALAIDPNKQGWAWNDCSDVICPAKMKCSTTCSMRHPTPRPLDSERYTLRLIAWAAGQKWWEGHEYGKTSSPRERVRNALILLTNSASVDVDAPTAAANIAGIVLEGVRAAKGDRHG